VNLRSGALSARIAGAVMATALTAFTAPGLAGPAAAAAAMPTREVPSAGVAIPGVWTRPVQGPVVRSFDEPAGRYGPGHRGVDLAAAPGTSARAAGDGTVVFAGEVAGALHVVVAHVGDLRTSYSFLLEIDVEVGQALRGGDVVGTTGGAGEGHGVGVLHFGLRRGDQYLDPMALFRPRDLTELVRLVPADEPAPRPWREPGVAATGSAPVAAVVPREQAEDGCGDGLPLVGGAVSAVCDAAEWVADRAGEALDVGLGLLEDAGRIGRTLARRLTDPAHALLASLLDVAAATRDAMLASPFGKAVSDLVEMGARFLEWTRRECSGDAPLADGTGGSGHLLMAVAGIGSSSRRADQRTFDLDTFNLGYRRDEVHWYSYAPDGGAYDAEDTYGDLREKARLLGEQLEDLHRREPGREVDLVAHSQGGVVVDVFLTKYYDASDPAYPPLGTVVTLASPHQGAPLATAAAEIRNTRAGRAVLDATDDLRPGPPAGGASTRQLAETSPLMRHLWDHGLPDHVEMTSIGGTDDVVVPANRIHVPGSTEVVVSVAGTGDHGAIPDDPRAMQVVRAALEHRAPPCTNIVEGLRSAIEPVLVTRVSHQVGELGHAAFGVAG
jgi:hypothetical protein